MNIFWVFPKIVGFPPNSSMFIGFSIINHPFWGFSPILGNSYFLPTSYRGCSAGPPRCDHGIWVWCFGSKKPGMMNTRLVVEFPTYLKKMCKSNWVHHPQVIRGENSKIFELPPASYCFLEEKGGTSIHGLSQTHGCELSWRKIQVTRGHDFAWHYAQQNPSFLISFHLKKYLIPIDRIHVRVWYIYPHLVESFGKGR